MKRIIVLAIGSALSLSAGAQAASGTSSVTTTVTTSRGFQVTTTTRTIQAVNYRHGGEATEVDFAGTALLPSASGSAKVRTKRGTIEVEAEFRDLQGPTVLGAEYLTYVLWAISHEGRAQNLGEVLVSGNGKGKLTATTDLQTFAMVVTAEPYYAVRQPSNAVVLENIVGASSRGSSEAVSTKYELMERGGYIPTGYKFDPVVLSANLPLEFYEARNALRIAQSEGADTYATSTYEHAVQLMNNADRFATSRHIDEKELIAVSRETTQTAEEAREIAVKKIDEDRRERERQASQDAVAASQGQADAATRLKEEAQSDTARAKSDAARAQADMIASQAASASAVTAAQADAEQSRLAAQQAQQGEHEAVSDKAAMRAQLSEQLNKVLQTRDSARGLIVSMSDVLFDTGQYSLKSGAREKLAKVAGILLAYPGLNIEVGGYTDNVGGDDMNQKLSENRAGAVKDYLVGQGVAMNAVSAKGFGDTLPVASNDNSSGRQENRRVELVVSGDVIGSPASTSVGSLR